MSLNVGDVALLRRGVEVIITDIATFDDLCRGEILPGYPGAGREIIFQQSEIIMTL